MTAEPITNPDVVPHTWVKKRGYWCTRDTVMARFPNIELAKQNCIKYMEGCVGVASPGCSDGGLFGFCGAVGNGPASTVRGDGCAHMYGS